MPLLRRNLHTERLTGGRPAPARAPQVRRESEPPRVVWRFSDGKPGHDVQTLGLAQALRAQADVEIFTLPVANSPGGLWFWLSGCYPRAAGLPAPDLLLGAGHRTHFHLLAARRRWGGRASWRERV